MREPIVETRELTMRFGGVTAVNNVSFTLREKELQERRKTKEAPETASASANPFSRFKSIFSVEPQFPEHKRSLEQGAEDDDDDPDGVNGPPEEKRLKPSDPNSTIEDDDDDDHAASANNNKGKDGGGPGAFFSSKMVWVAAAAAVAVGVALALQRGRKK